MFLSHTFVGGPMPVAALDVPDADADFAFFPGISVKLTFSLPYIMPYGSDIYNFIYMTIKFGYSLTVTSALYVI